MEILCSCSPFSASQSVCSRISTRTAAAALLTMSFGRRNNFMDPNFDPKRGRPGAAATPQSRISGGPPVNDNVPNGLLMTARQTGVLNLANKDLTHVPDKVWQVSSTPESKSDDISLDRAGDTGSRWWEVEEVRKLLLSANRLEELSDGIGQLRHLTVVDLRDNRLARLPAALCSLGELRSLNASKNRLTELPTGLSGCPELTQLYVSGNLLSELPPDIGRLDRLAELDVSDNRLSCLPDSLAMLDSLRVLEAGRNQLEALPAGLARLPALNRLGVAGNQLAELPPGPYSALEVVDAAENRLKRLPALAAARLKELRLSSNRIGLVEPELLAPLVELRHLELRQNCLAELPDALPRLLPRLERLDLTDNDLSSLPCELGLLEGLKCLLLEGNPMRALRRELLAKGTEAVKKYLASRIAAPDADAAPPSPVAEAAASPVVGAEGGTRATAAAVSHDQRRDAPKSLQSLQAQFNLDLGEARASHALKYSDRKAASVPGELLDVVSDMRLARIDLSGNELAALPDRLTRPPFADTLRDLSLRRNRLADLDPGVGRLTCLSVLDLSGNLLSTLPRELAQLTSLRQLALSENRFEDIPEPVYSLPGLDNLLLGNNRIGCLNAARLRGMASLGTLDLKNNNLTTVPPELGLCRGLRNLHLEGNPFRVPRPAQLSRGTAFVMEYLRSRIEGGDA